MSNDNIESVETVEETVSTGINYGKVLDLDRTDSGKVDLDASMERIRIEAELWVEANEVPISAIADATVKAWQKAAAKAKTDTVKMASLTSRALMELDAPLESETRIGKRIVAFVQGESSKFVESEGREGTFQVVLGRDGGTHLVTDAYRTAYQAKLAAKAAKSATK